MPAGVRRYEPRHAAYTRRGKGSPQVGPRCHTCGGAGVWFERGAGGDEPRPRVCRDCPAFWTKKPRG
jgi:hypothetical protein